jgi:cellulose synthase/poly-beta-1,6-N-acetylglucosamine synthase-like glycosyltransferase
MLLYLGLANLLLVFVVVVAVAIGGRKIVQTADLPEPDHPVSLPHVSLIVAARNEERNIEAGVRSLLALDYPNL